MRRPSELPPALALWSLAFAFLVGACWGSFLNVVVARVPAGTSVVRPRSRCPKCGTQIAARDNLPVLSWILLRGRCRTCKAAISPRYPMIELLLGLAGTAVVARAGWSMEALELFVLVFLLTAIAFIDLDTWTVPHPLWIALVTTGFLFGGARAMADAAPDHLIDRAIGAGGGGLVLAAVVVAATGVFRRTGRIGADETAMGWGDPLIVVGIGAYLGWRLLPMVILLASVQGTIAALALRARGGLKGDKPVSESDDWVPPAGAVPFGPFLALGALEAAFFGDALLRWAFGHVGLGE
ncbi:MAG: prepilin peptidase [Deltaproteobacteria bacterium]|nr:prepilin peptidase [Deltaproteobacteria bacterium]